MCRCKRLPAEQRNLSTLPARPSCLPLPQMDVVVQFLMGCFVDPDYVDSYSRIALRNLTSFSGFWFDCVTSMPWSYMDFSAYQARAARGRGWESWQARVRAGAKGHRQTDRQT